MTDFAVSADGVRIAFDCSGAGRPILLIHGFASNRLQSWHDTGWVETLATAGRRVITLDVRGHGESDRPHAAAAYGDLLVTDMCAVLGAAEAASADVMGYSMGSHLAISLLVACPAQVERLVIGGVGEAYFARDAAWFAVMADALEVEDRTRITDPIALAHRIYGEQNGNDRQALAAFMRVPPPSYSGKELARVPQPVLVACGEYDSVSGRPEGLAAAFQNARTLILAGRDHGSALDCRDFKAKVMEFLKA